MESTKINFLNVPIDIIQPEDIEKKILELIKKDKPQHIIFITLLDLLNARYNTEFRNMILDAELVIPVSSSILKGAKFLKNITPINRQPFDIIIDIMNVIDSHYKSIYLLGGRKRNLLIAEKNVKATFPGISVIGRFNGFYPKSMEQNIITAISKSQPTLTVISNGIHGGRKWAYQNEALFKKGIFIYENDIIDIFAKTKKKPSTFMFNTGLSYIVKIIKNPFRILNIFRFLWYKILLLWYKIFKIE